MQITRRGLITGLASFVAAPAILRVTSIMPVKVWRPEPTIEWLPGEELDNPRDQLSPEAALDRALCEYWHRTDERKARLYLHYRMLQAIAGRGPAFA